MQYPTSPCSIDESFVSYSERLPSLHIPTSPSLLRRQGTTAAHKKRYMHNWENIFGRHTSKYSARGLWDLIKKEGKIVLFLVLLGATVSVLDYGINESIMGLRWTQAKLFTYLESQQPTSPDEVWNYSLGGAIAWGLVFALISISWTHYVDPFAAGSGIPEIKTILSADQRHAPGRYLRSRTLFAKSIGLATAQASGLSVGKEGPFVHTACIICHQLMKHCAFFHRIYRNESLHRHMYNAACAVGVASTFGAPIGGVLFSIEVTSSFLLLSNYWKSFVAAVSGSVMKQVLDYITTQSQQRLHSFQALFPTSYSDKSFGQLELFAFAFLGVLMGVLGATYVSMATRLRRFFAPLNRRFPLLWGGFISVVVTVVVFTPGPFNHLGVSDTLKDLCSPTPLGPNWQWQGSVLGPLAVSAVSKIFITLLSVSLPIPSGDFIPLFTAGAACGRLIGELIIFIFPTVDIVPGGYALVGGAALVASSTHTISVAVIALELTGQFIYFTPLFLAVLLAGGMGKALSVSIYDSVIISKGLPYLPMLLCHELRVANVCARDVMEDQLTCLPNRTTKGEIRALLKRFSRSSVPVVVDRGSRLFCGCVAREDLHALLAEDDHDGASNLPTATTGGMYMRQTEAGSTSTMVVDAVDDDHVVVLSDVVEMSGNVLKVDEDTPLETVHLLFEMLKCAKLFVTKFGVLEGVVTRASMHNRLTYLAPPDPSALMQQPVERHDDMVC
ncbi:hypothetical protein H257_09589 [Aphanomyces astaci]|uniref:CBS domain-containing protein n=1 Tax=Aphanomyces astaci TaxID=112090 RepID=W4GBF6_APHAT|nr:hypothetical protein H257_09589 [Aphanomyces astaci]ETV76596.1 hypothetical protein H257_09589 [Aphanomyces astaci]|eukprot:XP_009834141.1 hypothetical protein H257_09589 [Aphanomyces astaci]